MGEEGQTVGERIYLIREALGTRRDPMPLEKFAELVAERTGVTYDKSMLSRMETGDRKVSLDDVAVLAQVDPKKRGREWLAWGPPRNPRPLIIDDATESQPDPRQAQTKRRGSGGK